MKDIKHYLHLYLGCECYLPKWDRCEVLTMVSNDSKLGWFRISMPDNHGWAEFQMILRPLSDMTEEECRYLAWFNMDSDRHLDADARITIDEIDTNIAYGDDGLMVDADAAVVIEIVCRCFEGQLCVRTNGDLEMWSDAGERLAMERQCENFQWLLSKGFDLFGLIEAGLAIDKTTLKQTV